MNVLELPADLRRKCANTLRFLAVDQVEKARSGHPGLPMGAADLAFVLWAHRLRFDPADLKWENRDRFVLSAGHGSAMLYALLHLSGAGLTLDDLKQFRQWGSRTPGHPESDLTPGVETTTGPLGQGFATAVGMAVAGRRMGAIFGEAEFSPVDFRVWGICGDGDLMEGVSAEAASLAGHLKLGNLNFLYDSNGITIDGRTDITFTEDVGRRFEAYGWHVLHVDGHDHAQLAAALDEAHRESSRPSLVVAKTTIGYGAPTKAGTSKVHGSPLGPDEARHAREALGWPQETFHVPPDVRELFARRAAENAAERAAWLGGMEAWRRRHPDLAQEWDSMHAPLPADLEAQFVAAAGAPGVATRATGGKVLQRAAQLVPSLVGGSADLDESTATRIHDSGSVQAGNYAQRNLHFGIREHAMGAIVNGLTLAGQRAFGATFLVFADYLRPALRLAALMRVPSIFVFTHDSVFLGEDGPTHQPVEHVAALRAIPNVEVWRPADPRETALAWVAALRRTDGPTCIVLSRQKVPAVEGRAPALPDDASEAAARVVHEPEMEPRVVLVATGSEVPVAAGAAKILETKGIAARVVSMPCVERFLRRAEMERARLLPPGVPVCVVEAGASFGWQRIAGDGLVVGIDHFGHSAPAEVIAEKLGFTPEAVAKAVADRLG